MAKLADALAAWPGATLTYNYYSVRVTPSTLAPTGWDYLVTNLRRDAVTKLSDAGYAPDLDALNAALLGGPGAIPTTSTDWTWGNFPGVISQAGGAGPVAPGGKK